MRHITTMLTVVVLMTVMMAMGVASSFPATPTYTCTNAYAQHTSGDGPAKQRHLFEKAGYTCTRDL